MYTRPSYPSKKALREAVNVKGQRPVIYQPNAIWGVNDGPVRDDRCSAARGRLGRTLRPAARRGPVAAERVRWANDVAAATQASGDLVVQLTHLARFSRSRRPFVC